MLLPIIVKDGPRGVDVDVYFGGTFVGCTRLQLNQEPQIVDPSPLLREFFRGDARRVETLVDRVRALRC